MHIIIKPLTPAQVHPWNDLCPPVSKGVVFTLVTLSILVFTFIYAMTNKISALIHTPNAKIEAAEK